MDATKKIFVFEERTCGRCGGSGHYSYCQRYGTRCFGCHGKGVVLTKRGQVAQRYYEGLCEVQVADLRVGMKVKALGVTQGCEVFTYWAAITEVRSVLVDETRVRVEVVADHAKFGRYVMEHSAYSFLRVAQSKQEKGAKIARALVYQGTLTVGGKVKTRAARTAPETSYEDAKDEQGQAA